MAKKKGKPQNDRETSILFAFIATFFSIVGFLIALVAKGNNKYVMFYAKQSLIIFIIAVLAGIVNSCLATLPILGWIIGVTLNILVLILWTLSWVYALTGEKKKIPLVADWTHKIKI